MAGIGGMIGADGEIDENFWATAAKEREGGEGVGDGTCILSVHRRYGCR